MKLNDLFSSSISLAKDGWASKEEWENRIKECSNCEHLTKSMRCKECGCFMKAKVRIKGAACPLGKW